MAKENLEERDAKVRRLLKARPDTSTREAEKATGVSKSSVNRIQRKIKVEEGKAPAVSYFAVEIPTKSYEAFRKLARNRGKTMADEARTMIAAWLKAAKA